LYDLLISGASVIDPANDLHGRADVATEAGRVAVVAGELDRRSARHVVRADGKWVLPGLIDPHVHVSTTPEGYRMMARAGVTCALDMSGHATEMIEGLRRSGAGLTVGFLFPLIPGETISGPDPSREEIAQVLERALRQGALGAKVVGGHYPLTPDATARVIQVARERRCWCAVHAGTLATGSNIDGLEELVELSAELPVHIAHVNSYCRGQRTGDPLIEASRALRALARAPAARSESYLSVINGTSADMEGGVPRSHVTRTCLTRGGYAATDAGMEEAIAAGWAQVHGPRGGEIVLLSAAEGLSHYRECETQVHVSFPVNSPGAAIALAIARTADGSFAVPALGTDGGGIPRNTTLQQGLALVRFGALSPADLVTKACVNPARMLGLQTKGHLGVGADADLVVVDPLTGRAEWVVANGHIVVQDSQVIGQGGRFLTTEAGQASLSEQGMESRAVAPDWLA
jgi:cytosine/adenosine deaminase-related metal-dependent hydrolase